MAEKSQNADSGKEIKEKKKRQHNNRKVFRLCRQTLMKGQWREIQITDINLKAKIQHLNYEIRFSSSNCTGSARGGGRGFEPLLFFFFFYCSKAKGFYVWVCVSVLLPRIEPVGKPYREVCLQTKW